MPAGAKIRPAGRARRRCRLAAGAFAALLLGASLPATAQTLHQALTTTYQTNPRIDAERARLRATDEEVARAQSGYRPTIQGQADYGVRQTTTKPTSSSSGESQPWSYGMSVSQPLFNGFRTAHAVSEAEAQVRAARENLRLIEAQTLLEAATAYADVVRDAALVRLNQHSVEVLTKELTAAEARRGVREITRTDVAQARARRARAVSALDEARANLKSSRATFIRVVGHRPGRLVQPATSHKLVPRSMDEALRIADRESASIIASLYREQASRHVVDRIRGEMLPEVRLEAGYSRSFDTSSGLSDDQTASIVGRLRVPIYQGGEVSARVRQAKHTHVSRLQEIEQARAEVHANVTAAWSRLAAARARMKSDAAQVEANRIALEGVRAEEQVGQRTLLDVLNAEQELLDAQTAEARTRRDATVAVYTLLAAVGRLDATRLELGNDVYDPDVNYHEARGKWYGTSIAPRRERRPIIIDDDEDGAPLLLVETESGPDGGDTTETGSIGAVGSEPRRRPAAPAGGPIVLPGHVPAGAAAAVALPSAGTPAWFPQSGTASTTPAPLPPTTRHSVRATTAHRSTSNSSVRRTRGAAITQAQRDTVRARQPTSRDQDVRPSPSRLVTGSLPALTLRGASMPARSAASAAKTSPRAPVRGSFVD